MVVTNLIPRIGKCRPSHGSFVSRVNSAAIRSLSNRCLGAARWIYQEERLAVRRLPFVPEAIATLDPVGAERSAVGEPVQLVRSEARSKLVVRHRYPAVFLGGDGMTLKEE